MSALFFQKLSNGIAKCLISNPVIGIGNDGFEATLDLVLALRSGVKALVTMFDGVFLALVIAGIKVQELIVGSTTPVAAIKTERDTNKIVK
ncbi:MAG: hypothetical protein RJQ14_03905 [Marinoscillum sp.]